MLMRVDNRMSRWRDCQDWSRALALLGWGRGLGVRAADWNERPSE
ncbi:MAG: hypothetical protein AB8E87_08880 [Prochlorococcus sp.]